MKENISSFYSYISVTNTQKKMDKDFGDKNPKSIKVETKNLVMYLTAL